MTQELNQQPSQPALRTGALISILASSTLPIMSGAVVVPALNELRVAFDLSAVGAGALVTAHTIFIAAASPVAGVLIDRVGARLPLLWGLLGFGIFGGLGAFMPNVWWLLATRIPFGIATGFIFTAITVVILQTTEGQRRNVVMGWRAAANQFGGILYPTLGGLAAIATWRGAFLVYLAALPIGLLVWVTLPKDAPGGRPPPGVWALIRSDRRLQRLYLAAFTSYVGLYLVVIFVPQLLAEIGLGNAAIVGLFLSAMNLAAFVVASMYGRLRKRLSVGVLLWSAGLLYVASACTLLVTDAVGGIAVAMGLFGAAHGLAVPSLMVSVGNCAPPPMRGRVTSGLGVTNYLGQFSSPYVAAPVVAAVGLLGAFALLGVAGAIVAIVGAGAAQRASEESNAG
jgi:MFS transporter, ACDE family, multidrug resistance protein